MSIEFIKDQIEKFVSSSTPEIMAIKGDWGVGKTFSWKRFLVEAKSNDKVLLNNYSYVSLFGVNSLEAFKYSIFENVIKKDLIGTEASIETLQTNTACLVESFSRKGIKLFISNTFGKGLTPAIESLSFLSLNKTLICIDDLERKGSGLDIKDILGLISLLKEQKECKIVLLLNDGEEGLNDYVKYREKVIDFELSFSPSAEECSVIAYDGDNYQARHLREFSQKLNIRNIRILKKIERLVEIAFPLTEEFEEEIKYQVIHSLVLFSLCYYSNSETIPTLEFVTHSGYSLYGLGDKKNEDEKEKSWVSMIQEYGYYLTDDFDLVLAEGVQTGFIDNNVFLNHAKRKNEEVIASKSDGSFTKAWELYHGSFDNNTEIVISGIYESFKENIKYISLANLNGTVTLFRDLNEDAKASEIIAIYISTRINEKELFNLKENNFFGDIKDQEIVDKFNKIYTDSDITEDANQVLERISVKNGWSPNDEMILANTSVNEYYDLFKLVKGEKLSSYVRTCLKFGSYTTKNKEQDEIGKRATEALKLIASESELNKRRVRKFGVEV